MFPTKLFRAALAPLALTAALAMSGTANAQVPYSVFAYAVGGSLADPCAIHYAIAPTGTPRYVPRNGYFVVRSGVTRAAAQQLMAKFSKYSDDQPDGVIKRISCRASAANRGGNPGGGTNNGRGPHGGVDKCTYALSKYHGLMQKLYLPQDRGRYGDCHDYGWWNGTHYRGHKTRPGYWVYAGGYWLIFSGRTNVR